MPKKKATAADGTTVKTTFRAETGHAKNVTNFERLQAICKSFGETYNLSRTEFTLAGMASIYADGQKAIAEVKNAQTAYYNCVHDRANFFGGLKKFNTRLLGSFVACKLPVNVKDNARSINKKLHGTRISSLKVEPIVATENGEAAPTPNPISTAQQSYDSMVERFEDMVKLVSSHPEFNPNEADLTITALQSRLDGLKAANTAVIDTETTIGKARIARNKFLYADETGLIDIVQGIKSYVKSVFEASSPEYKKVSSISFKRA